MKSENEHHSQTSKKKLSIFAVFGIGCFLVIVMSLISLGIAFAVATKLVSSSLGQGFLKTTIERVIGIKLENGKNGENVKFTNTKTGESLEVNEGKIPANFPKDFPLYPNAKPSGTAVGSDKTMGKGFWLLLESDDSLKKVTSFYDEQLEAKGWIIQESNTLADGSAYTVKKEKLVGAIIIATDKKSSKTTILITLTPTNEQNPAPQEVAPEGAEPVEESF